jgi:hypothetical protein
MSYLNGIASCSQLGKVSSGLQHKILSNKALLTSSLQRGQLHGLGKVESVIPFSEVVSKYNQGITRDEIVAWVWYRRKSGVPMKGWDDFYIKANEASELKRLVHSGVLFYMGGELMPFPVYTYGNMYDREIKLNEDKEYIAKTYGMSVVSTMKKRFRIASPSY